MPENLIIVDTWPRKIEQIFDDTQLDRLASLGRLETVDSRHQPDRFEQLLDQATIILGQPDLPVSRLDRAQHLKAIINVEGNFFPNVNYQACFARGIPVLSIAPAFAVPVAEMALGLALDLARGITSADVAMRAGTEQYGTKSDHNSVLLSQTNIGIIGYGGIGRALRKLLSGFSARVGVFDPWLPDSVVTEDNCLPQSLDELLEHSDAIFVCTASTSENRHLLGRKELERIKSDAMLVLISRADVVDFAPLLEMVNAGRFVAAVDVFPEEPVPANDPVRHSKLLLSSHRAGGIRPAMSLAAEMILDDLSLILAGLSPVRLQPARKETVGKMRSKPVVH